MDPNSRFFKCESEGFPAVSVYSYETNIPIRGIDNRLFRWEEVSVESIYQLKEATASGSFEDNTFRTDLSVTNHTGVNLITSTGVNTTSYKGWTVSGNVTTYIGLSGIWVNSGNLSGVTSSFQAHPLDGDEAIGLYCYSGINYPTLISNSLPVGSEGAIIIGNTHQVYLKAISNYGGNSSLQVYPRGWAGGAIACYYNPQSYTWQTGVPTGAVTVGTGLTTIKYTFPCSTFPSLTPTGFDLIVRNTNTGTFITVDDIHLDAYMYKNAFIDFLVPTGYVIQMTPDLGWHNMLDMFESTVSNKNPHLRTFGPYQVDLGNLTDNLDNTVTATVDISDIQSLTNNKFSNYLWRALPLSPNGTIGAGGLPARFKYIGNAVNDIFSVDKIVEDDLSTLKVILGTKSQSMTVLVNEEANHPGLSYPTANSWKLEILLDVPYKTISVRGIDAGGATSSARQLTLKNKLYSENSMALWNVFDEHGLIADIERLPKESNYDYSIRIKDGYKNRSGPTFVGVVNGGTRELGLTKIDDALSFSIPKNVYGVSTLPQATIVVTSYSIRITYPGLYTTEKLLVDPIYLTCDLSYLPLEAPDFIEIENGFPIEDKDISMVDCCTDNRIAYRLKINKEEAAGKFVVVKYKHYIELLFKDYPTINDIVSKINTLTNVEGNRLLNVEASGVMSGSEDCLGLYISTTLVATTSSSLIAWSPFILKKISDRGYRDYFIRNDKDTIKQTEYYSYVKELKNKTKIFWGSVEADRDRWDAADSKQLAMDSIPTQFDPSITKIISVVSGAEIVIDPVTAWGRNYIGFNNEYLSNVGLSYRLFQPGVGHTNDLTPSVYFTTSNVAASGASSLAVGPVKNNNNVVLFSGQA
jgi:hypothetical protein